MEKVYQANVKNCEKAREISADFLKNFNLSGMTYYRIFNNNKLFRFCSSERITKIFFEKQLYNENNYDYSLLKERVSRCAYSLDVGEQKPDMPKATHSINIWNSCGIFKKYKNFIDILYVGGDPHNYSLFNLVYNDKHLLNHFFIYVKSHAIPLIQNENVLISRTEKVLNHEIEEVTKIKELKKNYIERTKIDRYFINIKGKDIPLSNREYHCLRMSLSGKSYKEIALELALSPRTVESYINICKVKINVDSKIELANLLKKYSLA